MARAKYAIEKNKQVLMVRPVGAWGENIAQEFVNDINQHLIAGKADFAGVIDLRSWELGTPAALAIIGKNIFYAATLGYTFEIHFGQPKSIPMQVSEKSVTPDNVTLFQCNDPQEAVSAFEQQGYEFDPQVLLKFLE